MCECVGVCGSEVQLPNVTDHTCHIGLSASCRIVPPPDAQHLPPCIKTHSFSSKATSKSLLSWCRASGMTDSNTRRPGVAQCGKSHFCLLSLSQDWQYVVHDHNLVNALCWQLQAVLLCCLNSEVHCNYSHIVHHPTHTAASKGAKNLRDFGQRFALLFFGYH